MHKGHFPATTAMNKTSINMMIGRQEHFVGSLVKKVQDYGKKKQGPGQARGSLIHDV